MNICSWGGGGFPVVPLVDVWFPARVTRGWSGSVTYIDRQETEVRETLTRSTCSRIWIHVVTFDILWELQRFSRTCAGAWRVCDVVNWCWPHTVYRQDIQHDSKLNMNIFDVWNERQEAVFSVAAASAGDNSEDVARDLVCSGTSAVSSWKSGRVWKCWEIKWRGPAAARKVTHMQRETGLEPCVENIKQPSHSF